MIRPQNGHWLKVDVDIWIDGVVTEVVLGQQRKVKLHRTLLQRFQLLLKANSKRLARSTRHASFRSVHSPVFNVKLLHFFILAALDASLRHVKMAIIVRCGNFSYFLVLYRDTFNYL